MDVFSLISIVVGIAILGGALFDIFMTVLVIGGGAGPQSSFVADRLWRLALRLHRPDSARSHSLLRAVGPIIVLLALAFWVLELCLGWAFIFVPQAFRDPDAVAFMDRMVFTGKAIVGRSGNTPALEVASNSWEVVLSMAGASGVIIVSVGLAYVLPILSSVAHVRSIAASVNALGNTPEDQEQLLAESDDGQFGLHLLAMVASVSLAAERHRSYPVLHYFHSKDPHASLAPAIAKLALVMRADRAGVPQLDPAVRRPLDRAILNLMEALGRMGLERYARNCDHIDNSELTAIILDPRDRPPNDDAASIEWLKAYVRFDGWVWEDFFPEQGSIEPSKA